nr:YdeI/OmpD-associated family protein [uncultured Carboxylicivirga sp.]
MTKKEIETFTPKSRAEWRQWLDKNHAAKQAIWLIYYKSSAKASSISWSEAVDEALCFGWIDSTRKTIDDDRFMQYFSKRKPNSSWSLINKKKVANLIENKQMTKAGYDSIETAKRNGSWTKMDEIEALVIPADLTEELKKYENATEYFDTLSKSNKKILLYWIGSAKRPETRLKRISEICQSASQKQKPKQFR